MSGRGERQPNLLLIMTDQHRADWLGCAGNLGVETPHIDALAQRGVRFARAACNSPVCAPSRASLASGLYPHRTGVLHNKHNYPKSLPTYYQALRGAGYRVGVVGKIDLHKADHYYGEQGDLPLLYHLGFTHPHETEGKGNAAKPADPAAIPPGRAERQSRDATGAAMRTSAATEAQSTVAWPSGAASDASPPGAPDAARFRVAGPYQSYLRREGLLDTFLADRKARAGQPAWHARPIGLEADHFHDSYIGRRACEFIETVPDDAPWHLFVSFVGPHHPWDAPQSYADRYAERHYDPPTAAQPEGKPQWVQERMRRQSEGMTAEALRQAKRQYAAAVTLLDDWVGALLARLEQRGFTEDTIVIFCSDHGEMLGDHGLFLKTVFYEPALRVPLIIADPRLSGQGRVSDALVELCDLHPTLLDYAGAAYDPGPLDGKSLLPLLRGETDEHKTYQISELLNGRTICNGQYKLIENYNDEPELYNLELDPGEQINRASELPEVADRLLKQLKQACK